MCEVRSGARTSVIAASAYLDSPTYLATSICGRLGVTEKLEACSLDPYKRVTDSVATSPRTGTTSTDRTSHHVELAVSRLAVRCGKEKREVCVVWTCCAYELAS